jgi:hypothetical protein
VEFADKVSFIFIDVFLLILIWKYVAVEPLSSVRVPEPSIETGERTGEDSDSFSDESISPPNFQVTQVLLMYF